VKAVKYPVSLDTIKADKRLKNMALVKNSRLSVSPVTADEFDAVLELSKKKL
jgi:predicted RNA-binding protein with PUA-like domain